MELNRNRFIEEILNIDFKGDTKECAIRLGIDPNYFNSMIDIPSKKGGTKLLGAIYQYCRRTGRNPEHFIFVEK